MDKHTQKHDTFLRAIMANKEIALDYFRACIPQHIQALLDFSTLEQLPDSYVSKELQKSISDIVYTCKRAGGKGEVKISLLVEHKSYVDKYVPIQIGSYIFSGLLKQISNKETPSLIIPILLYHGKDRWEYKTLADLFGDLEPALKGFVPDYQYIFHNLGKISDDEIQTLYNKFLAASLLAMKHSAWTDQLIALIPTILTLTAKVDKSLRNTLLIYTFEGNPLSNDQISELMKSLPSRDKNLVMDALQIFKENGRKEGLAEAFAESEKKTQNSIKNFIKLSLLTDEQIASAMDVDVNYVANIRKMVASEQ